MKKLRHPNDRKGESKPAARVAAVTKDAPPYDPEKENSLPEIKSEDYARRFQIPKKALEEGGARVRGRFAVLVPHRGGETLEAKQQSDGTYRLQESSGAETDETQPVRLRVEYRAIGTTEAFQKLLETPEWVTSKLLESEGFDAFDLGCDLGTSPATSPNNEFVQIMGGPFSKQLYLYDYLEMHAKAFWLRNHHPLAAAAVRILRSFAIGKGVKVLARDHKAQEEWDNFVARVRFNRMLREDVDQLIWGGEIMTEKELDGDSLPAPRQIDPSTVWEVVTDPADIRKVFYYHQQYPSQWQLTYKPGDIGSEYIINDIDAAKVIHVKVGSTSGEKRGRSLLFPVMAWLKRYRDYLNAKVIKAQNEESQALDIEVDGDKADVDAFAASAQNVTAPKPGQVRVHNTKVKYSFLQPTSSSTQGRDNVAEQLKNAVAIGMGLAPEWLGESAMGSNRATALVKENPAARNIEELQTTIEEYVQEIFEWVVAEGQKAGRVPKTQQRKASLAKLKGAVHQNDWKAALVEIQGLLTRGTVEEPTDLTAEVIFPEMQSEDRKSKLDAISQARADRMITKARAAEMTAKELGITSFNWDEEREAIQQEIDSGEDLPEWGPSAGGRPPELPGEDEEQPDPSSAAGKAKYRKEASK